MKVGDLVKFKDNVKGMKGRIGIVVNWNGAYPVVKWHNGEDAIEVIEYLEVIA